jgi:CBS domain-containing protein
VEGLRRSSHRQRLVDCGNQGLLLYALRRAQLQLRRHRYLIGFRRRDREVRGCRVLQDQGQVELPRGSASRQGHVHIERPVANLAVVVRSKGANREREPQEVVMKISEVMTAKPQVIKASESVLKAAELLARDNIGALPVERDDRLIGMLTDRDIVVRVVAGGKDPAKTKVLDVVSDPLRYCYEDEDVKHVAENMHQLLVRRLPVMNRDKRLVGIVSIDDLEPRKH